MSIGRGAGWRLALLWLLGSVPASLHGQSAAPLQDVPTPGGVSRLGITYLDLRTGEPIPAVEVTYYGLSPLVWRASTVSGLVASARGSFYMYGGLQLRFPLPYGIAASPSLAAGVYEEGSGLDLGHFLEFRSALLLEVPVSSRIRLSAVYYHLSNAGLADRNPGTEGAGLGLSFVPEDAILSRTR
jgi:lipid A 3-O-deacylase